MHDQAVYSGGVPPRAVMSPSSASTVTSGLTPSSSSGSLPRFTQHVQSPKHWAPAMSQKFDDTKAIALSGTARCCEARAYTRGLDLYICTSSTLITSAKTPFSPEFSTAAASIFGEPFDKMANLYCASLPNADFTSGKVSRCR